jgi:hypothetical protein
MQPKKLPTILLMGLCLSLLNSTAMAQRDRFQREYPVKTLAVTETEAEMGAEYNYFGEEISNEGSGTTEYSNHYFQEYLLGRIRGYGYHPRFIDYSGSLRIGFSQQRLEYSSPVTGSQSNDDNDNLLGYNLRMDILKENNLSGTLSASRDERILMGLFIDRYRVLTESMSGTVRWRSGNLRMDLTGTRTETEETGFRSSGHTKSDTLLYNLAHDVGKRMRTDLRYRLQQYERDFTQRTAQGTVTRRNDYVTNDLNLTNRLALDPREKLTLRSTFRFNDRSANEGSSDLRTWYLEELLRHNASRVARPYMKVSAHRNEFATRTVDTYRGEAGLDGDLFDSLSYHFDLHATRIDQDAFTEDRYGPTGSLGYRKRTGVGLLSAGYSRTLEQVERSGMSSQVRILDEQITLRTAFATFLREADVIASSIRVTDLNGQVVYQEGFDYEIVTQGNRVGLRVIPGGLLADGSTVLVEYSVDSSGKQSYLSDDESISVRHDFSRIVKDLSLYGRRHTFRARNVESAGELNIVEYTNDTVGLRQGWRQFAFTSEYEMYDDDLGGYDRWRNQLEGYHNLGRQVRWGWNAGIIETWYDEDRVSGRDDDSRHLFAGTHLDGTFARTGYWRVEGNIMEDTGRLERTTRGVVGRVGYNWRRVTLESGLRLEQYEAPDNDQDRVQFFLGMKFHLGRRIFASNQR